MNIVEAPLHCPCKAAHFGDVFAYDQPPECEIRFKFSSGGEYRREVKRCGLCGHFVSIHEMNDSALYSDDYVTSNYGDNGIHRAFDRIILLDPARSDNVFRVRRIMDFAATHFRATDAEARPSVLDVGSGLCVFLHRMKANGWNCTALDPDARSARHAQEYVGVDAVCGDFMTIQGLGHFDVVTFNKVLEHVKDPVVMLAKSLSHLNPGGFVYIELPDGEQAVHDGPAREEFTLDHLHVFSATSMTMLAQRAGFIVVTLERLREPSGKYTLWAFLVPAILQPEATNQLDLREEAR
jgi:2-polyprenyl-3-methyl-5-hydroxy-6-metoxy-1,4-benzoquinol methylase